MEGRAIVRIFNTHGRGYKFINNFCHKSEENGLFGKPCLSCCGKSATVSKRVLKKWRR
jgi:hypothetical protein